MRVMCVQWGDKYPDDYVLRLRSMCARHLPEHTFCCLSDHWVRGEAISHYPIEAFAPTGIPEGAAGWWQKLALFNPQLCATDEVILYLDLDVVIVADLEFPEPDGRLWVPDDFSYSLRKPRHALDEATQRLLGGPGTVNSSVMCWRGYEPVRRAWTDFRPEVTEELHGDQNWITRALWPQHVALWDGVACSYKYHVAGLGRAMGRAERGQGAKPEMPAPIIVFHGDPKPHQIDAPWVQEHWH